VPIEPAEPEEPVARIDPLMTARRQYRSPWDAMTEAAMADEPEEDPFAAASRSPRHHGPGGYFSH
jgi:hypothetical protein